MAPVSDAALSSAQKWQDDFLIVDEEVSNVFLRLVSSIAPSF